MAHVTGIGGVFIKFKNPVHMRKWYSEALGLTTNDYGVLFRFNNRVQPGFLQLGTFEDTTTYFGNEHQQYMINFRVDNLDAILEKLGKLGTKPLGEIETYEYGKFAHILDPEGNRLELWEPIDESFSVGSEPISEMS